MSEVEITAAEKLITELCQDNYYGEVLRFFARHPFARFDRQVLVTTLGLKDKTRAERTLAELTQKALLENTPERDLSLYRLTRSEPMRSSVISTLTRTPHIGNIIQQIAPAPFTIPPTVFL